jgi:hypothetical protein
LTAITFSTLGKGGLYWYNQNCNPWEIPLVFKGTNLDDNLCTFISRLSRFEIFWVLSGAKKVSCIPIKERNIPYFMEWCSKAGLEALESSYRYTPIFESSKANYTNVAKIGECKDGEEMFGEVFVSLTPHYAKIARASRFDDRAFGYIMDYPSCCIEFYIKWFESRIKCGNDYVLPSINVLDTFPFYNNTLLNYFEVSLVSHFPCSPRCAQTNRQAKNNLKYIEEHSPELCKAFKRHLRSFVIYTENEGVAYATHYERSKNIVCVKRIFSVKDTCLDKLLSENNEVIINSYDNFSIGNHNFSKDCRVIFYN